MGLSQQDKDMLQQYFNEMPSKDAAAVALAFYAAITLVVLFVTVKTRTWFMLIVPITGFLEVAGFAFRIIMIQSPQRTAFIIMQCLLIISPVLLAIAVYMCVGRLLQMSPAGKDSRFSRWVAKIFTLSDILTLMLQGAGGGLISGDDPKSAEFGRKLLLAGLFLQLIFFASFTFIAIRVQFSPTYGYKGDNFYRMMFMAMYLKIFLMFVRNIFRVSEFVQGFRGYLASHEVFFYAFDFVPLFLCFVLFSVYHYGFYLGPAAREQKMQDDKVKQISITPSSQQVQLVVSPPAAD